MRPCYYVSEPSVGRVLIPGCWGAAVYGKDGCTCGPKSRADHLTKLEARLSKLEAMLSASGMPLRENNEDCSRPKAGSPTAESGDAQ